jgi:hypothetical protein
MRPVTNVSLGRHRRVPSGDGLVTRDADDAAMHDRADLFPRKWIIGAVVALLVIAPLTWAILTFTESDPPPPELVAEVQGLPPSGGGNPCIDLVFADVVAQSAAFSQAFRFEVIDTAGANFDEAAATTDDESVAQSFEAIGTALESDAIKEATASTFALETFLEAELDATVSGIDLDAAIDDVRAIC